MLRVSGFLPKSVSFTIENDIHNGHVVCSQLTAQLYLISLNYFNNAKLKLQINMTGCIDEDAWQLHIFEPATAQTRNYVVAHSAWSTLCRSITTDFDAAQKILERFFRLIGARAPIAIARNNSEMIVAGATYLLTDFEKRLASVVQASQSAEDNSQSQFMSLGADAHALMIEHLDITDYRLRRVNRHFYKLFHDTSRLPIKRYWHRAVQKHFPDKAVVPDNQSFETINWYETFNHVFREKVSTFESRLKFAFYYIVSGSLHDVIACQLTLSDIIKAEVARSAHSLLMTAVAHKKQEICNYFYGIIKRVYEEEMLSREDALWLTKEKANLLYYAVLCNQPCEEITRLMAAGYVMHKEDTSPAICAATYGRVEILQIFLLNGIEEGKLDIVIDAAMRHEQWQCMNLILDREFADQACYLSVIRTALNWTIVHKDTELAYKLLNDHEYPVDLVDCDMTLLGRAIALEREVMVEALLNYGANPNLPTVVNSIHNMVTPLCGALQMGYAPVMKVLLKRNVNPDQCVPNPDLPLVYGAIALNNLACLQALLEAGATVNSTDVCKKYGSLLFYAICKHRLMEAVELIIRFKVDIDAAREDGANPLLACIQYRHLDLLRRLLQLGAKVKGVILKTSHQALRKVVDETTFITPEREAEALRYVDSLPTNLTSIDAFDMAGIFAPEALSILLGKPVPEQNISQALPASKLPEHKCFWFKPYLSDNLDLDLSALKLSEVDIGELEKFLSRHGSLNSITINQNTCDESLVDALARAFTRLKSLGHFIANYSHNPAILLDSLKSVQLKSLTIQFKHSTCTREFANNLLSFTQLESLSLSRIDAVHQIFHLIKVLKYFKRLKTLSLDGSFDFHAVTKIANAISQLNLTSLALPCAFLPDEYMLKIFTRNHEMKALMLRPGKETYFTYELLTHLQASFPAKDCQLEAMHLGLMHKFPEDFMRSIRAYFRNIKSVELTCMGVTAFEAVYQILQATPVLDELSLKDSETNVHEALQYPVVVNRVSKLSIELLGNNSTFSPQKLSDLVLKMKSIKFLSVHGCITGNDVDQFLRLLADHPHLQKVEIQSNACRLGLQVDGVTCIFSNSYDPSVYLINKNNPPSACMQFAKPPEGNHPASLLRLCSLFVNKTLVTQGGVLPYKGEMIDKDSFEEMTSSELLGFMNK